MEKFVLSRNATMVSIYVASDSGEVRPWFDANVPKNWNVIQPKKVMPKPENGVWFGEHGSKTGDVLNQTMKNEAMAEATAEVFALGECDALMIPNFSSFSYSGIALTRARGNPVFFAKQENEEHIFQEMSTFASFENEEKGENGVETNVKMLRNRRRLMVEERVGRTVCDEEL